MLALLAALAPSSLRAAEGASKVLVLAFLPAGGGDDTGDIGRALSDTLIFELHDGVVLISIPREKAQGALARLRDGRGGSPLTAQEAFRLGRALRAEYVVYGVYQKTSNALMARAMVAFTGPVKLYKVEVRGPKLSDVQDALASKVRQTILEGPGSSGANRVATKRASDAQAPVPPPPPAPEPDALAAEIATMSPAERKQAAVAAYNQGVRIGGDSPAEREQYERAIRYDPRLALAHLNLGLLAYKKRQWDVALEHLRKFTELAPNDPDAPKVRKYVADAESRLARQVRQETRVVFVATPEQEHWSAIDWFNAALGLGDDPQQAIEYYRQAVAKDPTLAQAHYNLGTLYYQHDRLEEAAASFRQYLRTAPADDPDRPVIENLLKQLGKAK